METMTDTGVSLPSPRELERICRGLATLDAILMPDWEYRYYSFNAAWAPSERMASMRNGEGDDWFIVFSLAGAFLKSLWHEYRPTLTPAEIYDGLPGGFDRQRVQPAFSMDRVTCGGWCDDSGWTLRGRLAPMEHELEMLAGAPETYRAFAADYFEVDVPLDAVAHVLDGRPLDDGLLARLRPDCTLADLAADLTQIGYGAPLQ